MIFYSKTKKKVTRREMASFSLFMLFFAVSFAPLQEIEAANASVDDVKQQIITVTGTVKDSQGEPVIGANVVTEDGKTGTITNIDGKFTINVPAGTKLVVKFIGYADQIVIAAQQAMNITLSEDSQMLDEVQVVAFGVQKKVTVTGAISSVKGGELTKTPTGSISNMLSGQLAGVTTVQYSGEPGSDAAQIFVRGKATTGNSDPLIQVDGV